MKTKTDAAIDRFVGARIRARRVEKGLTQEQLAAKLGVTYQQLHKYERGINRITAGRLWEIARALEVPVGYFYEGGVALGAAPEPPPVRRLVLEITRGVMNLREPYQNLVAHIVRELGRAA